MSKKILVSLIYKVDEEKVIGGKKEYKNWRKECIVVEKRKDKKNINKQNKKDKKYMEENHKQNQQKQEKWRKQIKTQEKKQWVYTIPIWTLKYTQTRQRH